MMFIPEAGAGGGARAPAGDQRHRDHVFERRQHRNQPQGLRQGPALRALCGALGLDPAAAMAVGDNATTSACCARRALRRSSATASMRRRSWRTRSSRRAPRTALPRRWSASRSAAARDGPAENTERKKRPAYAAGSVKQMENKVVLILIDGMRPDGTEACGNDTFRC